MKRASVIALATLALLPIAVRAQSASDAVRVEVKVIQSSDRKDIPGSRADEKTQHVKLEVNLTGKPKDPETRVIKWAIFGKEMKGNSITTLESGEEKLALSDRGAQKFESKEASTTSTPEHAAAAGKGGKGAPGPAPKGGGKGGRPAPLKKVEGSGAKYTGWGVQVRDGEKIVGEQYSGMSFKEKIK
jgi:hypothetical protein